jgi:hypothetical protein
MLFLEKIYCPEEQRERANKALPNCYHRLLAASSIKKKPTVRKKLSNIQRQLMEQDKKNATSRVVRFVLRRGRKRITKIDKK